LNDNTGIYEYTAAFLPAGAYTLAFTCQARVDDPEAEDPVLFVPVAGLEASVTAGRTTTLNFTSP
jgi:hypothetical protein